MMININQNGCSPIKSILEECSKADVWENQAFGSVNMLTYNIVKN